jgi:hypothetical protein
LKPLLQSSAVLKPSRALTSLARSCVDIDTSLLERARSVPTTGEATASPHSLCYVALVLKLINERQV